MTTVKIYTTPTCPFCQAAKAFMTENSVEFESIDVTTDATGRQWMMDNGHSGVPVIVVTNGETETVINGFGDAERAKLSEALGLGGATPVAAETGGEQ